MEIELPENVNCKMCYGQVDARARFCPHCRSPQNAKARLKQYIPFFIILLVTATFMSVFSRAVAPVYQAPADFQAHKSELSVKSSAFSFSECSDCNRSISVVTIGLIENNTSYSWEDFKLEVRFYDKNGAMIDSMSDTAYGLAVPPKSEVSFRVFEKSARPSAEYASHKVFINGARQTSVF